MQGAACVYPKQTGRWRQAAEDANRPDLRRAPAECGRVDRHLPAHPQKLAVGLSGPSQALGIGSAPAAEGHQRPRSVNSSSRKAVMSARP